MCQNWCSSTNLYHLDTWMSYATLTFRSETPTSISWSPDSSLFAVSVGPCVAIYHAQTSSLCQTLTSPNGRTNNSSHFIGGGGRFLLASGSESLVLWDLIDSRGMSTISSLFPCINPFHQSPGNAIPWVKLTKWSLTRKMLLSLHFICPKSMARMHTQKCRHSLFRRALQHLVALFLLVFEILFGPLSKMIQVSTLSP